MSLVTLTAQEFAQESGHSLRTVRRWIAEGMAGVSRDNGKVSIDQDAALAWLEDRRNVSDEVHIAQARRWMLRRQNKLEGRAGLVNVDLVERRAQGIVEYFDRIFGGDWPESAAWSIEYENDPGRIVGLLRDSAHPGLLCLKHYIDDAIKAVTPSPEMLACDRRIEALELEMLPPRARAERARVDYLTTDNQIEAGEIVRADRAGEKFNQAGILINREIRNIARRVANEVSQLTDHAVKTEIVSREVARIHDDLVALLTAHD